MKRRVLLFVVFCLLFPLLAYFFGIIDYLKPDSIKTASAKFVRLTAEPRLLSYAVYGAFYIVLTYFSVPVNAFMILLAGFLFGFWPGFWLALVFSTLGSSLVFISIRFWSKPLEAENLTKIKPWQQRFEKNSLAYLILLRIVPIFPFFLVNFAAAFFALPLKSFVVGTLIGKIPISLIYSSFGSSFRTLYDQPYVENWWQSFELSLVWWVLGCSVLGIFGILVLVYKSR